MHIKKTEHATKSDSESEYCRKQELSAYVRRAMQRKKEQKKLI